MRGCESGLHQCHVLGAPVGLLDGEHGVFEGVVSIRGDVLDDATVIRLAHDLKNSRISSSGSGDCNQERVDVGRGDVHVPGAA